MKIEAATELGTLIRTRRETLGIRQGDLASIAGVDQGNLSKIERGTAKATLDTYLRLCSALGIDLVAEPRA
ncbi:MAG TPA: helix-turn-helix domain-containing protein [Hyphomonas sp.]|nr:helix-turn-helix domain-containing protein [Hyphomonas sp.]